MPLILRRSRTQYVAMGVNKIVKVIPQYCTAHPVLRIITRNWQQNIMAAFLACLSLHARKMGGLERHGWEEELEICGKEEKQN